MNTQLISLLEVMADMMELKGENQFKVRAFRNAAQSLRDTTINIAEATRSGALGSISGIGKGITAVIEEFVATGTVQAYEELAREIPPSLIDMTRLQGLGPKKALAVYEQLGITSIGELEYACRENRLKDLKGFGEKTQEKLLRSIQQWNASKQFARQHRAFADAEFLLDRLRALPTVHTAELTGDVRRCAEVVGLLHILVTAEQPEEIQNALADVLTESVYTEQGITALSPNGIRTHIEFVVPQRLPLRLFRTTGSNDFLQEFDALLSQHDLTARDTAITTLEGEEISIGSESDIFALANLPFLPPEIREGVGELPLVQEHALPTLIEERDMRGMLHIHSTWSDGHGSVREMALAAKQLGYEYIALCDHSKTAFYANGLTADRVQAQHEEIDKLNSEHLGITILKGIESDILADGSLDYSDSILDSFDLVVASVHSQFSMPKDAMTQRIINAIRNPYTTILGHPTGRLLLARDGYALDMDAILEAAAETHTVIEINANPYRLDLDWRVVRKARTMGIRIAINPDAHHPNELRYVRYGIGIARKGLLAATDVINTLPLEEFRKTVLLKK